MNKRGIAASASFGTLTMKFFIIAAALLISGAAQAFPLDPSASFAARFVSTVPVHGCHHTYAHDLLGWHRHGTHCETQRGLASRFKRNRQKIAL